LDLGSYLSISSFAPVNWSYGGQVLFSFLTTGQVLFFFDRLGADRKVAIKFEKYLKTGSGKAFLKKHELLD